MYAAIYVIGVFQPKQMKTCAIVCRPFEILCEAAEKFNVCEENISLQFTVHDTSHHISCHICKQCLRKLQKRRGLRTRQAFRRKPAKKLKSIQYLAVTNRGQRKFKHFTTASEIKSYQEHPQKHKPDRRQEPQEMITQYASQQTCFMTSKCKTQCGKNKIYSVKVQNATCTVQCQ